MPLIRRVAMSGRLRVRVFFVGLALSFNCGAVEPLPHPDLSSINTQLSTPFAGLVDDYLTLLPSKRTLSRLGTSWSSNRDAFKRACRTYPAECDSLVTQQFDLLTIEWQKKDPKQPFTLRDVVVMSAVSDLCQLSGSLLGEVKMGSRCHGKWNIAAWASMGWYQLGYDALFVAFYEVDLGERSQYQYWLEHDAKLAPDELKRSLQWLERGKAADELDAYASDSYDTTSGAFSAWFISLYKNIAASNNQGTLTALSNLAKVSAKQGRLDDAERWWRFSEEHLAANPQLKPSNTCLQLGNRFLIDVEQARDTKKLFEGVSRLQNLIDQSCGFSSQAVQYGLLALKAQQPAQALEALRLAKSTCEKNGPCHHTRTQEINALFLIAEGKPDALKAEATHWLNEIHASILYSNERQIVWTLAERLYLNGEKELAASLYQALDEQIDLRRNSSGTNDPNDLARYDDLKRTRVRVDVEQGKQILPMQSENMRGKNLLRRLRTERWEKELNGVVDVEAKATMVKNLALIEQSQATIRKAIVEEDSALTRAILQESMVGFEESKEVQRDIYLGRLLSKKNATPGFLSSWALGLHDSSESFSDFDSPITKLGNDEAYLSWLRVPGGYVGTLLAVNQNEVGQIVYPTQHRLVQRFIAFDALDEAVLQLYRDLLQEDEGMDRGGKLIEPDKVVTTGIDLNGTPLWQLADGRFIKSDTAPANARQMVNIADLSDALYQRLLAPFSASYADSKRLIISPDGTLTYLPFETLTRQRVAVIETIDIGYVQSLSVFAELKKRSASKKTNSSPRLLSVANPQYQTAAEVSEETATPALKRMQRINWPELPGTKEESAAISRLFQRKQQLLGKQASKISLNKMQSKDSLAGYQVLHFATHGYVDDERSALVLSAGDGSHNAYLMDQEIVGWHLDSDLVLLSACNTGIGRQQTGEGIVGLPYAFFMAGNINTLMSLWPVDDAGTAKLMPEFMRRIQKGEDHFTALSNTKRAFARGDFGEELRSPRVWSAFVLYGVPIGHPVFQ